jgi:hypothetical protein
MGASFYYHKLLENAIRIEIWDSAFNMCVTGVQIWPYFA